MRMKLVSTFTLSLSLAASLFLAASVCNKALAAPLDFQAKSEPQLATQNSQLVKLAASEKSLIGQFNSDVFGAALSSVASLRLYYAEHLGAYGQSPESINDLGVSEHDFQGELVEHVGISSATGAILIGLDDQFGDKQWAALIPTIEQYQVTAWSCQTTLSQANVGSVNCKSDVAYSQVDHIFDPSVLLSAISVINSLKPQYGAFYQETGQVPTSMQDLGVEPGLLESGNISHLIVDPNTKTIAAGLNDSLYGTNQWISFTPIIHYRYNFIMGWTCRTTLSSQIVNAAGLTACVADQGVEDLL